MWLSEYLGIGWLCVDDGGGGKKEWGIWGTSLTSLLEWHKEYGSVQNSWRETKVHKSLYRVRSWRQRHRASLCKENESRRWRECRKYSNYLATRWWRPNSELSSRGKMETGMLERLKTNYWQDLVTDYRKGFESSAWESETHSTVKRERGRQVVFGRVSLW